MKNINDRSANPTVEYNLILDVDSYKVDHQRMLPDGIQNLSCSIIPRKPNKYSAHVVAMGQQYASRKYLQVRITQEMIDEAEIHVEAAGYEFNRERWEYILHKHNGKLPLEVRAVPEGTVLPVGVPSVVIEATDPKCAWLTGYIETMYQRIIWKMSTVASISRSVKQYLQEAMATMEGHTEVPFHLHNFGSRGASSFEASIMAGMAHLTQFSGTDDLQANKYIHWLYNTDKFYGSSVIATEHSVSCAQADAANRDDYPAAVMAVNLLEKAVERFERTGKGVPVVSVVIDTYDAFKFVREFIGIRLKQRIKDLGARGGRLVCRPDSGDAVQMPIDILELLFDAYSEDCTVNKQGFRNLPPYIGVIQGDGINEGSLRNIVGKLFEHKISLNCLVFGMGGGLTNEAGRDEFSFAMKATARQMADGKWIDMFKDPITDHKKKSLKGRCTTYKCNISGNIFADRLSLMDVNKNITDMLEPIFRNGEILVEYDFDQVRENAK